jgi:penicillin amidase
VNPPEGFFVTANNDLNRHGKAKPINMPMGDWRASRIEMLLRESGGDLTVDRVSEIHYDVVSHHAETFMKILRPLLPESESGRALREWDCTYEPDSQGAYLFERIYHALLQEVFGANGLGDSFDFLVKETGIFVAFYSSFDRVLLSEKSAWFGTRSQQQIYQAALSRGLDGPIRRWGDVQKILMTNILFGGRLPRVFGFDRGPITIRGGRATIHQGQIYRSAGRNTSFVPSFRMILDLGEDAAHTNLAGGPSDRRFSKWYDSDTKNWLNRIYKKLQPG